MICLLFQILIRVPEKSYFLLLIFFKDIHLSLWHKYHFKIQYMIKS